MDKKQIQVALGGLYHDIGKVMYRHNDGRSHPKSGYDFLKANGITDAEILNQVRYHHSDDIKGSSLADDSLAYITYWADNVAAGADRRNTGDEVSGIKYDKFVPLQSVFNILNKNNQKHSYDMQYIYDAGSINYPKAEEGEYSDITYSKIEQNLRDGIAKTDLTEAYVNSVLGIMEANLSFVPSSTDRRQLVDISLFDHVKMTAAIGSCIYEYLKAEGVSDYKEALYRKASEYYNQNAFLMFSMDISGIQNFIFNVDSKQALKALRSKSFYLEIMLEHIIDELLERINVSRANLIYSGGGHAYILLPNTEEVKQKIAAFDDEIRSWFIDNFRTELYVAMGYTECSANALKNEPTGSYSEIFKSVSGKVSEKKASRYTPDDIRKLNSLEAEEGERECRVCGRVDNLVGKDICEFCAAFKDISEDIQKEDSFITVLKSADSLTGGIRLPLDRYMIYDDRNTLTERIGRDENYLRSYSQNKMFTGYNVSTRLWVGNYHRSNEFSKLAGNAQGIERIGVLRADVDNLGKAFVGGFPDEYTSITRTATFSRKLNMFFKLHINYLLENGEYGLGRTWSGKRNVSIVYSGGDDVFLVGGWNDVIEAGIDLRDALKKYTQDTLTISAGIGMFPAKYPVKALARQTGELEDASKSVDGKNALTLFEAVDGAHSYNWDVFKDEVIGEKFTLIDEYFSTMEDKGMSAMYKLMEYIRHLDDKINLARLAYMLGRMEPDKKASDEIKALYRKFSKTLYEWISDDKDGENRRQLITAIYLYVYLHRK